MKEKIKIVFWTATTLYTIGLLMGIILLSLAACRATKKSAAQQAYEHRQAQIELLKQAREMFPCDTTSRTVVTSDTVFQYMRKDSVVYLSPDDSIVYINKYHTVERVVTKTNTVLDMAALQAARDSIDNINFLFEAAISGRAEQTKYIGQLEQKQKDNLNWKLRFWLLVGAQIIAIGLLIWKKLRP